MTLAGLCPRCSLLGPNIIRLPDEARRRDLVAITLDDGPDPDVTEHRYVAVSPHSKVETLVEHLSGWDGLTLVFVRTKRGADRLSEKLARHGVKAEAMQGDLSQRARQRALERFESGKVRVLVATDVAARGLDIDGIEHVINFDPPEEDKGYLHHTGAPAAPAGVAGRPHSCSPTSRRIRAEPPAGSDIRAIRRVWHGRRSRAGHLHEPPRTPVQVVTRRRLR